MRNSSRFKFLLLILAIITIIVVLFIVEQVREHPEYAPMFTDAVEQDTRHRGALFLDAEPRSAGPATIGNAA